MRKSIKNIISGIFGQLFTMAFGILIPRLVILSLGSEANGLMSSINTVIGYLNLLEAGIGTAALQALYGPVAKADKPGINGILAAVKGFYRRTGAYYALGILGLAFIYPAVVQSEIPVATIFVVILLSGMPNVINYYFQGKYKILLQADGRYYVITNVQTLSSIITSISKILLINHGYGVLALQFVYFLVSIGQMIFFELYIRRVYAWVDIAVSPNFDALSKKGAVLVHQISGLVFNSTDTMVLSVLCGLETVSIYSIYTMLFGMVSTLVQNINNSISYIMGQTFNTDRDKYLKMHDAYEVYNMALTFSLYAIAGLFILPFIKLYTAGAEISYLDRWLPHLFIATYLLENGRTACIKVIHYAGHFKQTRWHAVVEMILNLSVSAIAARFFGIYGVLLGTVAALLFRSNAMIFYAAKRILKRSPASTYYHWAINIALYFGVTICSDCFLKNIVMDSYLKIAFWAAIACAVWIPVFLIVNSVLNQRVFSFVLSLVKTKRAGT